MRRLVFRIILLTSGMGILGSCSGVKPRTEFENRLVTLAPTDGDTSAQGSTGCLNLMNRYCDSLYLPGSEGNLIIEKHKGTPIYVLQGKTRNGLHHVFYELARSKIRNRGLLPKDFYSILKAHRYFEKLDSLIHREPFETMTLMDRIEANEVEQQVEHVWNLAISDTLLIRLTHRFPEFPQIPSDLISPEMGHFAKTEKRELLSEISKAIWRDHPNWKKVASTFETLRRHYLEWIPTLPIPSPLKQDWDERIRTLELVLPGSMPEIVDQDCSSTTINAFYYPHHHVLTVCAGDFNSEDIVITLAHEMAHALDSGRSLHLYLKQSALSKKIEEFSQGVCGEPKNKPSCSEWRRFKKEASSLLDSISDFEEELPEFNRCLKKEPTTRELDEESIQRFAESAVRDKIRSLADEEAFIRLTQPKLPLPNGKKVGNPSHLNPCHYLQSDWKSEELNGELSMLTVFTMDFVCSNESDPPTRLKNSLSLVSRLFEQIESEMIRAEGEFSERKSLIDEGYSSPSSERFADRVGSMVVAKYLREIQSTWDRRMTFLAGNSWQCDGPSLSTVFPKETEVLRRYLLDTHTDGEDRKKDLLSPEVRSVLECEKDFEWRECGFSQESR